MHTLYDFISSVYAVQYGLALLFIVGFIVFCEILKPRPFEGLKRAVAEDVGHLRAAGRGKVVQALKGAVWGPVCALCYLAAVPFLFMHAMAVTVSKMFIVTTQVSWSPVRAYFTGRKKAKKAPAKAPAQKTQN
jgi:hypothetical protein